MHNSISPLSVSCLSTRTTCQFSLVNNCLSKEIDWYIVNIVLWRYYTQQCVEQFTTTKMWTTQSIQKEREEMSQGTIPLTLGINSSKHFATKNTSWDNVYERKSTYWESQLSHYQHQQRLQNQDKWLESWCKSLDPLPQSQNQPSNSLWNLKQSIPHLPSKLLIEFWFQELTSIL